MNSYKKFLFVFACFLLSNCGNLTENPTEQINEKTPLEKAAYAIAIHGGAGTILKKNMTPEKETAYIAAMKNALTIGENMLKNGAEGLDVIQAVIISLENDSLFNAGKGAVLTHEGRNELDASIMEGKTMNAGAVGSVTNIKNPILAARAVMEKSKHVMMVGKGAETFAVAQGIETVGPSYFLTKRRLKSLENVKAKEAGNSTGFAPNAGEPYRERLGKRHNEDDYFPSEENDYKFGTVGCVVLDKNGNLAAGTSTGGMTNKRWNRIGDSPIIGAGTYANNNTCAVSATGHGEFFIRFSVTHDISARMEYLGESLEAAADFVINKKLIKKGGSGGVIAVDKLGNISMPHNTPGMYRAWASPKGNGVRIYGDEAYPK